MVARTKMPCALASPSPLRNRHHTHEVIWSVSRPVQLQLLTYSAGTPKGRRTPVQSPGSRGQSVRRTFALRSTDRKFSAILTASQKSLRFQVGGAVHASSHTLGSTNRRETAIMAKK